MVHRRKKSEYSDEDFDTFVDSFLEEFNSFDHNAKGIKYVGVAVEDLGRSDFELAEHRSEEDRRAQHFFSTKSHLHDAVQDLFQKLNEKPAPLVNRLIVEYSRKNQDPHRVYVLSSGDGITLEIKSYDIRTRTGVDEEVKQVEKEDLDLDRYRREKLDLGYSLSEHAQFLSDEGLLMLLFPFVYSHLRKSVLFFVTVLHEVPSDLEEQKPMIELLRRLEGSGDRGADGGIRRRIERAALPLFKSRIRHLGDRFWKASERHARSAVISRNLSHNIGSHVLASLDKDEVKDRAGEVAVLHRYLQERMDLTAQLAHGGDAPPEPMRLFEDILLDFFQNQSLLLDYLVRDDGFPLEYITVELSWQADEGAVIIVELEPKRQESGKWRLAPKSAGKIEELRENDPVIAVPGGVVGRHAILGLLENAIRNSAKWGTIDAGEKLEVIVEVSQASKLETKPDSDRFLLMRYSDNASDKEQAASLNERLSGVLVSSTGEIDPNNWGLKEMKVYAETLRGPGSDFGRTYYSDKDLIEDAEADMVRANVWYDFLGERLALNVWLQKARLLHVVGIGLAKPKKPENRARPTGAGISWTSLENLPDRSALLGEVRNVAAALTVFAPKDSDVPDVLDFVRENHTRLPGRLLLACPTSAIPNDKWDIQHGSISSYGTSDDDPLPPRRLFLTEETGQFLSLPENAGDLVVDAYSAYVAAFASPSLRNGGNSLNVGLYFEREKREVKRVHSGWVNAAEIIENSGLFSINLVSYRGTKQDGVEKIAGDPDDGDWVVFQNHRNASRRILDGGSASILASHQFGGTDGGKNDSIDRLLRHPPAGALGAVTLLQLVESTLARVAVLDERVNRDLFTSDQDGDQVILSIRKDKEPQRARLFPIVRLKEAACFPGRGEVRLHSASDGREGIEVNEGLSLRILHQPAEPNSDPEPLEVGCQELPFLDYLVLHKGFVEKIESGLVNEKISEFYSLAPRVIWTTGRASAGHGNFAYPIVNASAIGRYSADDFSKYHCYRCLIAAMPLREV